MNIYKNYARDCINSKKISGMGLNLPTTSEIDEERITRISQVISYTLSGEKREYV